MDSPDEIRNKIIGLGDFSLKKSYYPQLQERISELNLFKTVFENTIDLIIIFRSNDGYIEYINEAANQFFKLQNTIYNKYLTDITNEQFWNKIKEKLNEQISATTPSLFKSSITINKKDYYIQSSLSHISDDETSYGSLIIRDISEIVLKEEELTLAKKKAEESEKLKDSFLANMSHEIRTPLNAIIGFSNLLNNNDLEPEKRETYIEIIENNCNDLLFLINDILDISKLEAGQFKINSKSLNVNLLIEELHQQYTQKIQQKGNPVILNYSKGLDDANAIITNDNTRLKQIFVNLLDNALKFTSKGVIHFGYDLIQNELLFYVKDTGLGIPKESLNLIFDRFRQADHEYTKHPGGTGLGLSICKGLVQLMGGRIWVQSIEGVGSEFFFTLPYNPS